MFYHVNPPRSGPLGPAVPAVRSAGRGRFVGGRYGQAAEDNLCEALLTAAAASADVGDRGDVDAVRTQMAAAVRENIRRLKCRQDRAANGPDGARTLLTRLPEPDTETRMAHEALIRVRHRCPSHETVKAAASTSPSKPGMPPRALCKPRLQALCSTQIPSGPFPNPQRVPRPSCTRILGIRIPVRTRQENSRPPF